MRTPDLVAAVAAQQRHLGARFHAFGDHLHVQAVRDAEDGQRDRGIVGVGRDVAHECDVDLQLVDREALHSERSCACISLMVIRYTTRRERRTHMTSKSRKPKHILE
jgi:hypothetical protein